MKNTILSIITAVLVLLFATALGLGIIHITDYPYKTDIVTLEIAEKSGIPPDEIMENYKAVMDYLSPFSSKTFQLPSLKYSASGAGHFEDSKTIFNGIYLLGLISAIALAALIRRRRLSRKILKLSGTLTLAIPIVFALSVYFNFEKTFVTFHRVFFSNDDWLFDPAKDEIINILPERFFMHCALLIALLWLLSGAAQLIASAYKKSK